MNQNLETIKSSPVFIRAKNLLLQPKAEWSQIAIEPYNLNKILTGYVLILAAIHPICSIIGRTIFGVGAFGFSFHPSIISSIIQGAVGYVLSVLAVFVMGFVVNALAPTFGAVKDQASAMKIAAYAGTAAWVGGIFSLLPPLGGLSLLAALYSLYLLYVGLPIVMKSPADKSLPYTASIIAVMIVIGVVVSAVTFPLRAVIGFGGLAAGLDAGLNAAPTHIQVNGVTIDTAKVEAASKQLQAQAAGAAGGAAATAAGAPQNALSGDQLKSVLPTDIAGYARTSLSAASAGAAGVGGVTAEAEYTKGDAHFTVSVADIAGMGGLGAMAAAMNVNSSKDTATGYERVTTSNGRMTTEQYNREAKSGKYGVLVGGRFSIEANGSGVSMDDLKAAVAAVGPDRLAAMSKG